MRKGKVLFFSLLALLLVLVMAPVSAWSAPEDYQELPKKLNQPLTKEWTVRFSQAVDPSPDNISGNNIYIINKNTNQAHPVELKLEHNNRRVKLIPLEPYRPETEYRLYVKKELRSCAEPHQPLQYSVIMDFVTGKDEPVSPDPDKPDPDKPVPPVTPDPPGPTPPTEPEQPAPTITISPVAGTVEGVTETYPLKLEGSLDQEAGVKVNGQEVTVTDKKFSAEVKLIPGSNTITVTATNSEGKMSEKKVTVEYKYTPPEPGCVLEPEVLEDLKGVVQGLDRVIASLDSEAEKDVARAVKSNIEKKIEDPCFDHTAEVPTIRTKYGQLSSSQQRSLQDAILYNISVQRLMRLAEYFGF